MIRRPMLFAACGCAASVIVAHYAGMACAAAVLVTAAAVMLLHEKGRRRTVATLLLLSYCLGLVSFWHADRAFKEEASQLAGNSIRGVIVDCEERRTQSGESYLQMVISTEQGRLLCKSYDTCRMTGIAAEGCVAEIRGKMKEPSGRRNPGCFDYALYLRSLRITQTMTCENVTVFEVRPFRKAPLSFIINRVYLARESFLSRLTAQTDPDTGGLIRAIMFGDKGSLDEDVLEAFRKNGTAHILAVSGLHIGFIYGFILKLWRWRRGWTFLLFNTVFFLLYAAAAGFSPSVTRAVIMVLLHIAAGIRNRRYDLTNAAFLVFIGVIARNPYMVFNSGFQMSFLAVLSLTLVLPYMRRVYSGVFLASTAVQVGLGPFLVYNFNYLSLLAVVINVPVVALTGIIVPMALICMVLPARFIEPLCSALVRLNEVTQVDGVTSFQIQSPPLWLLAVYYLLLLMFATEEGRLALLRAENKGKYVLKMLIIIVMLSAGFTSLASDRFGNCEITFVDVGQGDCVCVRIEGGILRKDSCYLFDGGGSPDYNVGRSILREYLLKNGISHVDGAFVTHLHTDHYKGICELSGLGMVDRVYVYEANSLKEAQIMEETQLSTDRIVYLGAGDRVKLSEHNIDSVYVDVLYPKRRSNAEYSKMLEQETDENLMSLVFKVTYSGRHSDTSVLITGDLGEDGEKELTETYRENQLLQSDILKVGHHGSKTSTSDQFLDSVNPDIAVIQVGKNNRYGHPTPETLERLKDSRASIYRNDLQGAVGVDLNKGIIKTIRTIVEEKEVQ